MNKLFGAIETCFLIVGSVIGAGFVSGREIISFFYGQDALAVAVSLFICFFTGISFLLCSRTAENNYFARLFKPFIYIGNLVFAGGMLSAIDALGEQVLSIPRSIPILSLTALLLSNIILYKGLGGLKTVNLFLVPFMVAMVVILCFSSGEVHLVKTGELKPKTIAEYFGLNVFMSTVLLTDAGKNNSKPVNILSAFLSSLILCSLVALMLSVFMSSDRSMIEKDIPVLSLTSSKLLFYPFVACMAFGIFTSLLSSHYPLFCLVENGRFTLFNRLLVSGAIFLTSRLGFYNIVSFIYPAVGLAGAAILFIIAISTIFFPKRRPKDT